MLKEEDVGEEGVEGERTKARDEGSGSKGEGRKRGLRSGGRGEGGLDG